MTAKSGKSIRKISVAIAALFGVSIMGGCATGTYQETTDLPQEAEVIVEETTPGQTAGQPSARAGEELLPPNAKLGECYARVWVEPTYITTTKRVLVKEASERIDITPAKYQWVEETVEVTPASSKLVQVPTVYGTKTESVQVQSATRAWLIDKTPDAAPVPKDVLDRASTHGIDLDAARPGMCFHEHYLPAGYRETITEVEISPASEKISIVPAQYRDVEKRVLVSEASKKVIQVPATYETVTERILDKPAHTVWKKGTGPIQKLDEATGEIMCLVEVPATYKTVSKRVIKTPATTKVIEIPASYRTITVRELVSDAQAVRETIPARYKKVKGREKVGEGRIVWHEVHTQALSMDTRTGARICLVEQPAKFKDVVRKTIETPASTKSVEIPAEYKTVKVRKLVTPPQENRIEIPAEYQQISLRELQQDGHMQWRSILCETNMTIARISDIQRALKEAGYDPGPIDGIVGYRTMAAVNAFQKDKGLPVDQYLNAQTVEALGVSVR
uniref:Peptidoglycan binding domain-containing protein n=1 Tax=Candidatus Kentrum sp. FM TaxID=2126340 RepID=A0A450VMM2_9GAMM|nr:MAG: Putative peptidoglycan binding domain-containing protein [Candidatus Kentron sp. FM]VFJ44959.1 MAG: Putative peptidoglycan binding domain-containing protein [Candidatus Kentron sp. FM]VFK05950.1 MAG: Putative peptidoglycan binding domain-containing protein [Candidatus Kentron sp. FM]